MGKTEIEKGELLRLTGQSAATLKGLCDRAILKVEERKISRLGGDGDAGGSSWQLNAEQQGALGRIRDFFLEKDCVLLQGVTSSGKTEVYIRLIQEYLNRGQQVLYMLPEIALTVQIVRRLQRVFVTVSEFIIPVCRIICALNCGGSNVATNLFN